MEKEQKITLVRIIASALLVGLSFIPLFSQTVKIILCVAAFVIVGADIVLEALKNILHGKVFDECFLMTVATAGALAIGDCAEAAAVMLFYRVGELFQDMAVERSRKSISELMDIRPDSANLESNGKISVVKPEEVPSGSIIVIKPGERIPLDGVIIDGASSVNTVSLTGESLPRDVVSGDAVISGCVNLTGLLRVKTTGVYGESTVAKILELTENASEGKAKTEKFITRFAAVYTPAVVIAALLLTVIPSLFDGQWLTWLSRALTFLVISCPCALVISVPLSFFGGIGGASKRGILFKGANCLEALAKTETIVFDKTGTLTKGSFAVTAVHPKLINEAELLELAAKAESFSDHPISQSLRAAYSLAIDKSGVNNVSELAGMGIKASVDGKVVHAGNEKLMDSIGVEWKQCHRTGTIIHVAVDGVYAGHIVISDEIKPTSAEAIKSLYACGVRRTLMLTGDRAEVARDVAAALKLTDFRAGLLPADKVAVLKETVAAKSANASVAFVGDGINDAPALKCADVGIAMGALGSDAAIEAADIVVMDDDIAKIPAAIQISRRTLKIVKQNIVFALAVKAVILLLGALGVASMWLAVFADVGVSLIAVINALRAGRNV